MVLLHIKTPNKDAAWRQQVIRSDWCEVYHCSFIFILITLLYLDFDTDSTRRDTADGAAEVDVSKEELRSA